MLDRNSNTWEHHVRSSLLKLCTRNRVKHVPNLFERYSSKIFGVDSFRPCWSPFSLPQLLPCFFRLPWTNQILSLLSLLTFDDSCSFLLDQQTNLNLHYRWLFRCGPNLIFLYSCGGSSPPTYHQFLQQNFH